MKMSLLCKKKMSRRLCKLDAEFRKGPKYPYWPGLSVFYAYEKAGYFDFAEMEKEARLKK